MTEDKIDELSGMVPSAIATAGTYAAPRSGSRRSDHPIGKHHAEILGTVPLFSGLSRRHLRRLAEHADVATFRPKEAIVQQGRPGGTFYVIIAGEAMVVQDGRTISTLEPGDFFGEISLLDGGPRTADVIAVTAVSAIRVFKRAFDQMLTEEPGVASRILAVVAHRLREAERSLHG